MNLIVENSKYVDYYTFLDRVFAAIPELQEMDWLITDLALNYVDDPRLFEEPIIIDGMSLNEILQKTKMQFDWAVLSGYSEKLTVIPEDYPYADGNPNFWVGSPKPQARGAQIEIVCWDSSCTLFINISPSLAEKLKEIYPDIKDLDRENELRG